MACEGLAGALAQPRLSWCAVKMRPNAPPPRQPQLPPRLDRGDVIALDHDGRLSELELSRASLAEQHANGVTFQTVRLDDVDLSGSRMATFEHCLLAQTD